MALAASCRATRAPGSATISSATKPRYQQSCAASSCASRPWRRPRPPRGCAGRSRASCAVAVQRPRLGSGEVHVQRDVVQSSREELLDPADRVADRRRGPDSRPRRSRSRSGGRRASGSVPYSRSSAIQPPKAPGTTAASGPVPGIEREPELVAVALDRRRARRRPLRAEDERPVAPGRPDERRQVAAGAVEVRLDDLQREAGRDGGVERVAALLEHGHPRRRREPVRRRHHPEGPPELWPRREAHRPNVSVPRRAAPACSRSRLDPKLLAIGLGGGLLSGLLGVGGGIVMVPLLVLWAAYAQRDAHAMSLGAIIPISIAGIATYGVAGEVRYGTRSGSRRGRSSARASARGCSRGSTSGCSRSCSGSSSSGSRVLLGVTRMSGPALYFALVAFGVVAGVASGLLGVGGGTLIVPFLTLAVGSLAALRGGDLAARDPPDGDRGEPRSPPPRRRRPRPRAPLRRRRRRRQRRSARCSPSRCRRTRSASSSRSSSAWSASGSRATGSGASAQRRAR